MEGGFISDGVMGHAPLTITFNATSAGSIFFKQWDFGDGNTTTGDHAVHTFEFPGLFSVQQVVQSQEGCTDTTDLTITVAGELQAFINSINFLHHC